MNLSQLVDWRRRVVINELLGYGIALSVVAAALIGDLLLERYIPKDAAHPTPLFFTAVMLSAWFGGVRPGLISVLLSAVAIEYFFGRAVRGFDLMVGGASTVVTFTISALLVAWLGGIQTEAADLLSEARDDLENRVKQRTAELREANEALRAEIGNHNRAEEALLTAQAHLAHVTRVTTLGEFAASIAHEVNQPLTAIATNANACVRWLDNKTANLEEARRAAERIARDAIRAGEVLGRIRGLLKSSLPQVATVNINDIIREVLELVAGEFPKNRVALRTALAPNIPAVPGDRVQLQQVVLNLLMNGIEALEPVTDRPRDLLISTRRLESDADHIVVAVCDSGTGIAGEDPESLFRAFHTSKPGGLGMGLSISRSIVENHGGRLWGVNNVTHGMTFQFALPVNGKETL